MCALLKLGFSKLANSAVVSFYWADNDCVVHNHRFVSYVNNQPTTDGSDNFVHHNACSYKYPKS